MEKNQSLVIINSVEDWQTDVYNDIDSERYRVLRVPFEVRFEYVMEGLSLPPQWLMENPVITTKKAQLASEISEGMDVVLLLTDQQPYIETFNSFRALKKEIHFHLHVMIICNFDSRGAADEGLLRAVPYYFEADSVGIININALVDKKSIWNFSRYGSLTAVSRDDYFREIWEIGASLMIDTLNVQDFSKLHSDDEHIWRYDAATAAYLFEAVNRTEALNAVRDERCLYEVVTTEAHPHSLCNKLKKLRYDFAHAHHYGYSEKKCHNSGACAGTCEYCDSQSRYLYSRAQKQLGKEKFYEAQNDDIKARIGGIMRFRQNVDGPGMRSLVAFDECALHCKYCLNKETIHVLPCHKTTSVTGLGYLLEKDFVYHEMTGGGVTFGGGEPLLNSDFIKAFHNAYPQVDIVLETSLNVEKWRLNGLAEFVSQWIIDIKDMNAGTYLAYTGKDNVQVIENLKFLVDMGLTDKMICRVPHIEGFNTDSDVKYSKDVLRAMGIKHIDEFFYKVL